jgi:hypothetical protein
VYAVLRDRRERQALAAQQTYAIYAASGHFDMPGEFPTVEAAIADLDALLDAEFQTPASARDRELLELMGLG